MFNSEHTCEAEQRQAMRSPLKRYGCVRSKKAALNNAVVPVGAANLKRVSETFALHFVDKLMV